MSDDARRDQIVAAAVKDGRFSAARAPYWRQRLNEDPKGVEKVIASLERVPLGSLEHAAAPTDFSAPGTVTEDELVALFGVRRRPSPAA